MVFMQVLKGGIGIFGFADRIWPIFRSVFQFSHTKTAAFRFWYLFRFADFAFFINWFSVFGFRQKY